MYQEKHLQSEFPNVQTLQYLDKHSHQALKLEGITVSSNQVKIGNLRISKENHSNSIILTQGDFHDLHDFNSKDLVYQIESFVHSDDPDQLLQQVSQVLNEGGTYCIIDDFLSTHDPRSKRDQKLLLDYKEGWHIGNLNTPGGIIEKAAQFGLQFKEKINLTPYLNIYPLRDRLIGIATDIYNLLPFKSVYWESLRGGHALQKATKRGLIQYWLLTFEKKNDINS